MSNRQKILDRRNLQMGQSIDDFVPRRPEYEDFDDQEDFRLTDKDIAKRIEKWGGLLQREQQPPAEDE